MLIAGRKQEKNNLSLYLVQRHYKWLNDPCGTAKSAQPGLWPIKINTEINFKLVFAVSKNIQVFILFIFCAALLFTQGCIGAEDRMSSQQLYSFSPCVLHAHKELHWELVHFTKHHRAAAINTFKGKQIFISLKIF